MEIQTFSQLLDYMIDNAYKPKPDVYIVPFEQIGKSFWDSLKKFSLTGYTIYKHDGVFLEVVKQ